MASSSLTIENVHAAYGAVRVIEDVSISVKAGETVALLGTNGNGKNGRRESNKFRQVILPSHPRHT